MNARENSLIGQASYNDLRIALHFKESAEALFQSNLYQDSIVLPALFLIRQYLELSLKYNIRKLASLSQSSNLVNELNNTHDLVKIHNSFTEHYTLVKRIRNIDGRKEKKFLDALKKLIEKIAFLDDRSLGFRYSENKAGQKIIGLDEVFNLKEVFDLLDDSISILIHAEDMLDLV